MAHDTEGGHPSMDYNEHNRTYDGFIRLTKYGIVALIVLLAAMQYFLVP